MGHNRLGALAQTRPWRNVVGVLEDPGSRTAEIASATAMAARVGLQRAKGDEGLSYSFWLLCQIPLAAKQADFGKALRALGLDVPDSPSAFDVAAGLTEAVESHLRQTRGRTDIGEIAQLSAAECLTATATQGAKGLFSTEAENVQNTFGERATQRNFGFFAQDFFARFTNRFLAYHLSRELSNHVGEGRRFGNIAEHEQFKDALELHCCQMARIVRDFAGAWHSKTNYESGITLLKAKRFAAHAMSKLSDELSRREGR
jgi:hypothetical protein